MLFLGMLLACTAKDVDSSEQVSRVGEETEYGYPSRYGGFFVQYVSNPDPIPLNDEFDITLWVYSAEDPTVLLTDLSVAVDAQMPSHDHGMNQLPVVNINEGVITAEGMLLHMTGYWEISVEIQLPNKRETAFIPIDCCET